MLIHNCSFAITTKFPLPFSWLPATVVSNIPQMGSAPYEIVVGCNPSPLISDEGLMGDERVFVFLFKEVLFLGLTFAGLFGT